MVASYFHIPPAPVSDYLPVFDYRIVRELAAFPEEWAVDTRQNVIYECDGFCDSDMSYYLTFVMIDNTNSIMYFYDKDTSLLP